MIYGLRVCAIGGGTGLSALLSGLQTRRMAFPAYVLAYRYRDALFRVVVCGQDASLLTGKAPWSVARIAGAIVLGLLVALALALVVLSAAR